jgi:hypothetical protein
LEINLLKFHSRIMIFFSKSFSRLLYFIGVAKDFYLRTWNVAFGQIYSLIYNKMYFMLDKEQCGILGLTVMIINKDNV